MRRLVEGVRLALEVGSREKFAMAVVDQHLRVRGFDNLFVADTSVMPRCPRANIHLTSIMIGERAGEWLREGAV